MWRATGVLPTNDTAATSGCASSASTASASPCTTLKTPSGNPASCTSSASSIEADGSFSDGFRTNALPQATALASIHSGTITGKLNGVMPATTPTRLQHGVDVDPGDTSELWEPFSRCGMPQANSTHSRPRATSPRGVVEHLAVLARDDPGQLVAVGVRSSSRKRNMHAGPRAHATNRPSSPRPRPRPSRRRRPRSPTPARPRRSARRGPGRRPGAVRAAAPPTARPPIQWPIASSCVPFRSSDTHR